MRQFKFKHLVSHVLQRLQIIEHSDVSHSRNSQRSPCFLSRTWNLSICTKTETPQRGQMRSQPHRHLAWMQKNPCSHTSQRSGLSFLTFKSVTLHKSTGTGEPHLWQPTYYCLANTKHICAQGQRFPEMSISDEATVRSAQLFHARLPEKTSRQQRIHDQTTCFFMQKKKIVSNGIKEKED